MTQADPFAAAASGFDAANDADADAEGAQTDEQFQNFDLGAALDDSEDEAVAPVEQFTGTTVG